MDKQTADMFHFRGFPGIRRDLRQRRSMDTGVADHLSRFIDETRKVASNIREKLESQEASTQSLLEQLRVEYKTYEPLLYQIKEQEHIYETLRRRLLNIEDINQSLLNIVSSQFDINSQQSGKLDDRQDTEETLKEEFNIQKSSTLDYGGETHAGHNGKTERLEGDEEVFEQKQNENEMQKIKVDSRVLDILELQYNLNTYNLRHDQRLEFINKKEDMSKNTEVTSNENDGDESDTSNDDAQSNKEVNHKKSSTKSMKQNFTVDKKSGKELGAISSYMIGRKHQKETLNQTKIRPKKKVQEEVVDNDTREVRSQNKILINDRFLDLLETKYKVDTSKLRNNRLIEIINSEASTSVNLNQVDEENKINIEESDSTTQNTNQKSEIQEVHKATTEGESVTTNDLYCSLFARGDQISVRFPDGNSYLGIFLEVLDNRLIWRNMSKDNRFESTSLEIISIRKLSN